MANINKANNISESVMQIITTTETITLKKYCVYDPRKEKYLVFNPTHTFLGLFLDPGVHKHSHEYILYAGPNRRTNGIRRKVKKSPNFLLECAT